MEYVFDWPITVVYMNIVILYHDNNNVVRNMDRDGSIWYNQDYLMCMCVFKDEGAWGCAC
jgi:hypothetical protein